MISAADLNELSRLYPLPFWEIRPIYEDCMKIWWDKGFDKCKSVIEFTLDYGVDLKASFKLQMDIDLM